MRKLEKVLKRSWKRNLEVSLDETRWMLESKLTRTESSESEGESDGKNTNVSRIRAG